MKVTRCYNVSACTLQHDWQIIRAMRTSLTSVSERERTTFRGLCSLELLAPVNTNYPARKFVTVTQRDFASRLE